VMIIPYRNSTRSGFSQKTYAIKAATNAVAWNTCFWISLCWKNSPSIMKLALSHQKTKLLHTYLHTVIIRTCDKSHLLETIARQSCHLHSFGDHKPQKLSRF
jgi:hypothetical protein